MIKNFIAFFIVVCFPLALLAQATSSFQNSTSEAKHAGTSNQFKIGSSDHPVFVEELVAFLNTKERNIPYYQIIMLPYPFSCESNKIDYYDQVLMSEDSSEQSIVVQNDSELYRQPGVFFQPCYGVINISGPQPYYHDYFVKSGCEHVIIDAVCSEKVQQQFSQWRENPTVQEIRNYINSLNNNECDIEDLNKQIGRYPFTLVWGSVIALAEKICAGTTKATLKKIEQESPNDSEKGYFILDGLEDSLGTPLLGTDENGDYLFTLPNSKNDTFYPGMKKQIETLQGMEYFRPSAVDGNVTFTYGNFSW